MEPFRTRLGKIKSKGGAELRVIEGKFQHHGQASEFCKSLVENADRIREFVPDMAGYVVIAWDPQGKHSLGMRCGDASPITNHMIATYVAEAIRTRVTVNAAIDEMNEQMSRWV